MSASGQKADICSALGDVCFTPNSRHVQRKSGCPLSANSGHVRRNYSITSSANNKNDSGIVRPSPLAVFKFTTKLNFVGS